jgi:hypothetical protein
MGVYLEKVSDDRQMLALTSVSISEFKELSIKFSEVYQKQQQAAISAKFLPIDRNRVGILKDAEDQLFFVLFYLKTYPTFDVLAYHFDMTRGTAWQNIEKYLPILKTTLFELNVLPARLFESQIALEIAFEKASILLVDATERPTQRPKNEVLQVAKYSGKKSPHPKKYSD